MTPHNEARPGDYAPTVLLPGDPHRAQWLSETFLDASRCVNQVRGALGFTGLYRGHRVSVQATGMGHPSLAIYVNELARVYGATTLIRIGTCGGLQDHVRIRELVVAETAVFEHDLGVDSLTLRPDPGLLESARNHAAGLGIPTHFGAQLCSDTFYHPRPENRFDPAREAGFIAVDMETSALFRLADRLGFRALSICTVVDNPITGEETAMSERQGLFSDMSRLALEVAVSTG